MSWSLCGGIAGKDEHLKQQAEEREVCPLQDRGRPGPTLGALAWKGSCSYCTRTPFLPWDIRAPGCRPGRPVALLAL